MPPEEFVPRRGLEPIFPSLKQLDPTIFPIQRWRDKLEPKWGLGKAFVGNWTDR